jgi:hypothetical protein
LLDAYNEKNQLIAQLPLELAIIEICTSTPFTGAVNNQVVNRSAVNSAPTFTKPQVISAPKPNTIVKTEEPQVVTQNYVNQSLAVDLTHEEVIEKWPEFLVKIKKQNHSLSFVLQNCEPQSLTSGRLCVVFKYKFHQDRVSDVNIKSVVEGTLSEVFGAGVILQTQLDENLEMKKTESASEPSASGTSSSSQIVSSAEPSAAAEINKEPGALMDNLLKAFGGEVIS